MTKKHQKPHQKLPVDIIISDILPRLPPKSIGRFLCVCKQWQSLFSTQDFRIKNCHHITTNQPRNNQKLVVIDARAGTFSTLNCGTIPTDGSGTTRPLPFESGNKGIIVLGSFDGLVCVATRSPLQLMFWNPLTGAYRLLKSHVKGGIFKDAFGFYIDSSNDYKLLHVVRHQRYGVEEGPHAAYIYSRRLDSWRKIVSFNYPQYLRWPKYQWSPATFCGRNLYFTVVSEEHSCIIGFDVVLETFREIQFPSEVLGGKGFNGSLVVMNGCLHLCVACHNINTRFYVPSADIELWRMDGGGGDWWMKVAACGGDNIIPFSLTPNCKVRNRRWDVTPNCKVRDVTWVFHKALSKVDVTSGIEETEYTYNGGTFYDLVRAIYVETLVSPNP